MKVIFTDSVEGVAHKGDMKNVKNGFFRNYLLPRSLAVRATPAELSKWEKLREQLRIAQEQLRERSEEIKKRLAEATLKVTKKVTKAGKLYGGFHAKDLVKAISQQMKVEIPEAAVLFKDAIRDAGTHTVALILPGNVETSVKLEISAE